ncbi:MAG: PAS domain S-box protein [Verrucomicrobiota bacterium]
MTNDWRSNQEAGLKTTVDEPGESNCLEGFFEQAIDLLCVLGTDGRMHRVNAAWEQALDFHREELTGRSLLEFVHAEDREATRATLARLAEGHDCAGFRNRLIRRDGSPLWVSWNCAAAREDGWLYAAARADDREAVRQVEQNLRASEERFRNVVENLSEGLIMTDLEGIILYANRRLAQLTGYAEGELVGQKAHELLLEAADWPQAVKRMEQREQGHAESYSIQIRRKDGGKIWVHVNAAPFRDREGGVVAATSAMTDITERRRAEEALKQSRRFLEKAQEVGHVGSWISYPGSERTVIWSRETRRIFGVDEFDGKLDTFYARVHPEDLPRVKAASDAALTGKGPYNIEHRIVWPDGKVRWVHEQADVETGEDGSSFRLVGVVQDITERKEAEEALRRSEEQYRSVVNQVREVIFQTDGQGRLTFLNAAWTQTTGFDTNETLGTPMLDYVTPEDRERSVMEFQPLLEGRQPFCRFESRYRNKGGGFRWIELNASVIKDETGRVSGTSGTLNDVTQRRQLEDQLRQMQKMDSVGQLAAGIAHDFNNLLTIHQGYVSLLLTRYGKDVKLAEPLKQISAATERAVSLTRQLLLFSRRQLMQPRRQDVTELISNMTRMLGRLLGEDIALQLNHGSRLPSIHADAGMMEQVIMNLAVNARDAMPNGGKLIVRTSTIELSEEYAALNAEARPGCFVVISVSDTGSGIAPENLARIFEPFFTTKDVGKGTGLGLATVHGIVKQHNGWVEVESTLGAGTTFRIYLPAAPEAAAAEEKVVDEDAIPGGHETILVVEDETVVRDMVATFLQVHGYKVLTAASGIEALALWRTHGPSVDLLFTDMVMPQGMSGKQLATQLLKNRPELKVIYTSGYSPEIAAKDLNLQEGVNFLQKPFTPKRLAQVIRNHLDQRR